MLTLTPRQVHLDFHTSPLIEGIGSRFSKENFQQALTLGNLSSITLFAKGHHSQCYYPTKVGIMHPHLNFDLLGEMVDAAHEIGVKAPLYITAGWSAQDAQEHPEWRAKRKDGSYATTNFDFDANPEDEKPGCSWINLCLNDGAYCRHIYDLTQEICDRFEQVDGLFYDICFIGDVCYCDECVAGMKALGMDPQNEDDAKQYYVLKHNDFMRKCKAILDQKHPNATIFFNSGGADQYRPEYHDGSTHFELEDLPTAWGGYDKMPPRAKFFANTGKDYLGMTGKFHTSWGEFGGFKPKEALKFEVASMLAYGAKCSIGDQMHPDGEMDLETYRNIGYAYDYVKQIEAYSYHGEQTTKLGLYLSGNAASDEGVVKMLLETQNDFNIVYQNNFTPFDTVVFPDCVSLDEDAAQKLNCFIQNGGHVLFTGESLLKDGAFQIDAGISYQGSYGYEKDYVVVGEAVAKEMITTPFLCYTPAVKVENTSGNVLSTLLLPYFNRTYGHYCSHQNTPYDKANVAHPAMVQKGNIIYIAHPICAMYEQYGSVYHKRYFINALNLLYKDKVLQTQMMSAGRVSFIRQKDENRYCLHMLYGSPIKRGCVEIIEDLPPIYQIPVTIRVPEKILNVILPLSKQSIPFTQENGEVHFVVPEVQCHQMIVLEY